MGAPSLAPGATRLRNQGSGEVGLGPKRGQMVNRWNMRHSICRLSE